MLNLDTRVHFDEIKLATLVKKLESPGASVFEFAAGLYRTLADALDQLTRNTWGGCLFDNLLMTTLHRAVALAQPNRVAMFIGQYLYFNMTWVFEVLFHIALGITKRHLGLCAGGCDRSQ